MPINARFASITQKYIKRYVRIKPDALAFVNRTDEKLTGAGVRYIIDKNVALARKHCPDLIDIEVRAKAIC